MADENMMRQATDVYETLCSALDNKKWHYQRHDEDLTVTCTVRGDDLPMDLVIIVNPRSQVVSVFSQLPFRIDEEKRMEAALAVCIANYGLVNGSFDYDIRDGEIRFRVTSSFRDSSLGEELFIYMVSIVGGTVDDYNDKFLMISKGMMSVQQFMEWEQKKNS